MIGYLNGTIVWSDNSKIILSVNGVGYEVYYPNYIASNEYGSSMALYIASKISEYGQALYGFNSIEEKLIFEILDNIKGVGSKAIFTIMSILEIKTFSQLKDIELDDLTKLPGVGRSTAQKFLLGLSTKIKKDFDLEKVKTVNNKSAIESTYKNEIELLVEWGMRRVDIVEFIANNKESFEGKSSESVIKLILQNFRK
jgi:Holliday junction DNA helicase RuvA subunit